MYGVTIRCPGAPSLDTLGPLLEALTEANARWYLDQWEAGRQPATRCVDGGVLYRSHLKSEHSTWHGAPDILKNPRRGWSCQECASLEAGARRAALIWDGMNPEDARRMSCCVLDERGDNDWHALVRVGQGEYDPTEGLQR